MHANKLQQGEQQAHALLEERVLEVQKWRAEAHTLAQRLLEEERRTADARYLHYIQNILQLATIQSSAHAYYHLLYHIVLAVTLNGLCMRW
jgi:hypothetical protein